jgi:hypothetical protein
MTFREFETFELGEIVTTVTPPKKIQTRDYLSEGSYPVIDQSAPAIAGWTDDDAALVYPPQEGLIVFGDHTCVLKFVTDPFAQGADGIKIMQIKPGISAHYVFAHLSAFRLPNDGYKRHFSEFKRLKIRIPDLSAQQAISKLRHSLDSKIAVNSDICVTVEAIAQSIFKSWFIDFDPVHSKALGERPEGMDAETAALFPDSFDESELGLIPSGWAVKSLGQYLVPRKGRVITKARTNPGNVPVVAGGLEPAYFHNTANVMGPVVTVSASGANAGFVRLYSEDIWASDCTYVSRLETQSVYFWYVFLKLRQEEIWHMQQGGAQPHIYSSDLQRLVAVFPKNQDLIRTFEATVSPLFEMIAAKTAESKTLSDLLDSLLPRLISGELEIPEELLVD